MYRLVDRQGNSTTEFLNTQDLIVLYNLMKDRQIKELYRIREDGSEMFINSLKQ